MSLKLVTAPAIEPITLQEAKVHLRLDLADHPEDVLINGLIMAAREYCEGFREERFITQTWDWFSDDFPAEVNIPLGPVQQVEYVAVKDSAGAITEVTFGMDGLSPESPVTASTDYVFDFAGAQPRLVKVNGTAATRVTGQVGAVTVRLVVGYGDLHLDVPEKFRAAMLLMLTHLYEHRGDENQEVPETVHTLLRQGVIYPMP